MVFLLGLGGGLGLPLSIPPGPEDPVLAKAAPEECLFYTAWTGTTEAHAQSRNQTEQLVAEPEIRRFVDEIGRLLKTRLLPTLAWFRGPQGDGSPTLHVDEIVNLAQTVLSRPAAVYVTSVRPDPRAPDVRGAALFNLGRDAGRIEQTSREAPRAAPRRARRSGENRRGNVASASRSAARLPR